MPFKVSDWLMLCYGVGVLLFVIYYIVHVRKGKKQFGCLKYKIQVSGQKYMRTISIILTLCATLLIAVAIVAHDYKILLSVLFMALIAFIYGLNDRIPKGISENGLFLWGGFVVWAKIKKCSVRECSLTFTISNMSEKFEFENDVDVTYDVSQKIEIIDLLKKNIRIVQ